MSGSFATDNALEYPVYMRRSSQANNVRLKTPPVTSLLQTHGVVKSHLRLLDSSKIKATNLTAKQVVNRPAIEDFVWFSHKVLTRTISSITEMDR